MPCVAEDELLLSKIVAQSFQMRRKTLRNCLKPYAEHLTTVAEVIDMGRRPEQLSVKDFVTLSNHINQSIHASETVIK
mgnify:FL=1